MSVHEETDVTLARNRATFHRYCDDVITGRDDQVIDEIIDADIVIHCPLPLPPGVEGLRLGLRMERGAFPDHAVAAEDVICEGDRVAARCTITGTHSGDELMGIQASGRSFEVEEMMIARFQDGRIAELWSVVDLHSMIQQLGA